MDPETRKQTTKILCDVYGSGGEGRKNVGGERSGG